MLMFALFHFTKYCTQTGQTIDSGPGLTRPLGFKWNFQQKESTSSRFLLVHFLRLHYFVLDFSPFNIRNCFWHETSNKKRHNNNNNKQRKAKFNRCWTINLLFIAHILCCCNPRKYSVISCRHSDFNSWWIFGHRAANPFKSKITSTSSKRTIFVKLSKCVWSVEIEINCGRWSATNGTGCNNFDPWLFTSVLLFAASELLCSGVVMLWLGCGKLSPIMQWANSSTINAVRISKPNIMNYKRCFL